MQPIQPLYTDENGTLRFKENAIVRYLLDKGSKYGLDLNHLACKNFTQEDREQFAQLIGYSLYGAGDLSYFSNETWYTAEKMSSGKSEEQARIEYLEETLASVREQMKKLIPSLFRICEEDLII